MDTDLLSVFLCQMDRETALDKMWPVNCSMLPNDESAESPRSFE